jgi:hypothetical protein
MNRTAQAALPGAAGRPVPAPRAEVSLRIERVVLEGFRLGVRDRVGLASAMQAELSRLLSTHGGVAALPAAASPRLDAGELRVAPDGDAQRLGRAIARSLYRGLAR